MYFMSLFSCETVFPWGCLLTCSSSYCFDFLWGCLPVRSSSCEVIFLWGCLPVISSSCEVVFLWGHLPMRSSYCEVVFLQGHHQCQTNLTEAWNAFLIFKFCFLVPHFLRGWVNYFFLHFISMRICKIDLYNQTWLTCCFESLLFLSGGSAQLCLIGA